MPLPSDVARQVVGDGSAPLDGLVAAATRHLVGLARFTADGRLVGGNDAFIRMTGHAEEAALRVAWDGRAGPFRDEAAWGRLLAALADTGEARGFEATLRTADGAPEVAAAVSACLSRAADGDVRTVDLLAQDVTALVQRRQRVQDAANRLIYHLRNTPLAVIEWDLEFNVVEWNPAAEQMFGYTRAEALGRHAAGLLVPEEAREHVDRVWQGLLTRTGGARSTNRNATKSGDVIVCDWYNTTLVDGDGRAFGVVSLVADSSRAAAMEADLAVKSAALARAEKMASLGLLVAGIAHEIKNPLNFINSFAELSLDFMVEIEDQLEALAGTGPGAILAELVPELAGNLRRIHDHGRRATTIISGMLMHARDSPSAPAVADVNDLVRNHVSLAEQSFRASDDTFQVAIAEQYDPALSAVPIAYQELSRVVLNLAANALHALRERQRAVGPGFAAEMRVSTRRVGDAAEIRVYDNGVGIPEELRRRIFDPFFTTKPPGEGTGLGLSMCQEIVVKRLGGRLEVDTAVGQYTQFSITVPFAPRGDGP